MNLNLYLKTKEKGICAKPPTSLQVLAKFMNFLKKKFHGYLCLMCEMCIKLLFHRKQCHVTGRQEIKTTISTSESTNGS